MENQEKNIKSIVLIFLALIVTGTLGFNFFKGTSVWVSFYETLHLMLSHFYDYGGEHEPPGVQLLSLILIAGSLIIVVYLFKVFGDYILGGQLKERMKRNTMNKTIAKLKDHYIICGYGRVGMQVAEELASEKVPFIVIDKSSEAVSKAEKKGFLCIMGDPTDDQSLQKANVAKAKGVLAVLNDDTDNLFITIAARGDNPDVFIVARASNEDNIKKFEKAGADRVALPYKIGGYHIATMALRPSVVDFLDVMVDGKHDELQVEELVISGESSLVGKSINGSRLSREKTKTTVLAINKPDGRSLINPSGKQILEANDKLIILGTKENLEDVADTL